MFEDWLVPGRMFEVYGRLESRKRGMEGAFDFDFLSSGFANSLCSSPFEVLCIDLHGI